MDDKVSLDFTIISRRLKSLSLPAVDYVVGIATGGIVPACLIAHQLDKPLALMHIQHRAKDNTPIYEPPLLVTSPNLPVEARRILLVDDVCVSGKTMQIAKQVLGDRNITTLVMKGAADHVLFPEIAACVNWPWKLTR
ncbi:MAG: phosphoribosyltransferase [Anaerolineae bacterium]|nr:phosphoribosyltransferase [Anaerolineae bacterium]